MKSTTTHKCSKYVMLTNMGCYSLTGIHKNIEPYLDHYITVSKSTTHGTMWYCAWKNRHFCGIIFHLWLFRGVGRSSPIHLWHVCLPHKLVPMDALYVTLKNCKAIISFTMWCPITKCYVLPIQPQSSSSMSLGVETWIVFDTQDSRKWLPEFTVCFFCSGPCMVPLHTWDWRPMTFVF